MLTELNAEDVLMSNVITANPNHSLVALKKEYSI